MKKLYSFILEHLQQNAYDALPGASNVSGYCSEGPPLAHKQSNHIGVISGYIYIEISFVVKLDWTDADTKGWNLTLNNNEFSKITEVSELLRRSKENVLSTASHNFSRPKKRLQLPK